MNHAMQMTEFGTGSDIAVGSMGSVGGSRDQTWTSQGILTYVQLFSTIFQLH